MCNQLDELCKGETINQAKVQNKYNLRSKQRDGKPSASTQPKNIDTPSKSVVAPNKEEGEHKNQPIIKAPAQEVK